MDSHVIANIQGEAKNPRKSSITHYLARLGDQNFSIYLDIILLDPAKYRLSDIEFRTYDTFTKRNAI